MSGKGLASVADAQEHVFAEPWQARAFALMVALSENGVFNRQEFQDALIARVGIQERVACIVSEADYYTRWLQALSDLLADRGIIPDAELTEAERHVRDDAASRKAHQHGQPRDANGRLRIAPVMIDTPA